MSETRGQRDEDEDDWSQISDQVMRKRAQNRLAQRKHRKSIKARLKELERLATRKDSPTASSPPSPGTPARGSSLSAKDHSAASTADMADLASLDVSVPGGGFPLDNPAAIYHHPPTNYPAVGGSLGIAPTLPVLRDVPFANTFPVSEWTGDGSLSPSTNMMAQSYAHTHGIVGDGHHTGYQSLAGEMDSVGRYLDQIESHDMQSHAKSSTSSWASSDRLGQSTDSSTIPDRILPSDSVSARESEISAGGLSSRTPLSRHGSRISSGSLRLLDTYPGSTDLENSRGTSSRLGSTKASPRLPSGRRRRNTPCATQAIEGLSISRDRSGEVPATLSSRIASALKTINALGFSGIEELTAQYYTADLQDRPALADAQRISRRRGLTRILAKLREHAKDDWTDWEAQGYREEIVRAAEDILGDECRRFAEEEDTREGKRGRNIVELKRQFQDELPNLYGLLGVLSLVSQQWDDADHSTVVVHAISSLLRGSECSRECVRSPSQEKW